MRSPITLHRAVLAAAIAAATLAPSPVCAQSARDLAVARQAFREGEDAENKGDLTRALERFSAALRVKETPQLHVRIGAVQEKMGKLLDAAASYRRGLEKATSLPAVAKVAKEQLEAVALLIPTVIIEAPSAPPGLVITLDGAPVPAGTFGARTPLDPGEHHLHAEAPGHAPRDEAFTVTPRKAARFTVDLAPLVVPKAEARSKLPGALVTAAGGAALVAGAVLIGVSFAKDGSIDALCGGSDRLACPLSRKAEIEGDVRAVNAMRFSGLGVGVFGAAGAAIGVWMLVKAARPAEPAQSALTIAPLIGGGLSGAVISGAF